MSFHTQDRTPVVDNKADDRDDYILADAGNVTATLTIAQLLAGILYSNPGAAATFTLPTAALSVAGDSKSQRNVGVFFYLRNDNGVNAITVAAGTGGTLTGSATVAANANSSWYLYYTNVGAGSEAYEVTRLG